MIAIRILGKDYALEHTTKETQPNEYGTCEDGTQTIKCRTDVPLETYVDTLLHECIHAIEFAMQLKMSERQVHGTATGLVALFRDNPSLIELLKCLIPTSTTSSTNSEATPQKSKRSRKRPANQSKTSD